MFSLTVFVGSGMWALLYRDKDKATAAYDLLSAPPISAAESLQFDDDFGHRLMLRRSSTHGAVLENLEETKMAHVERALHQQRMQIAAQNMAQADSTLRNARALNGPAIIQPMGNGGFPRG